MSKITSKILIALMCLIVANSSANASSVFIASITLLSTKSATDDKLLQIKNLILQKHEIECLAIALYHEARGEPVIGQYAVGATIMNRVRSKAYPNKICDVVFQNEHLKNRCQFSFACDGISDHPRNKKSYVKMQRLATIIFKKGIAREAKFIGLKFAAKLGEMTHYHRHDVHPIWSDSLEKVSSLGDHVFFTSKRVTRRYSN